MRLSRFHPAGKLQARLAAGIPEVSYNFDGLLGCIDERENVHVLFEYEIVFLQHFLRHPVNQSLPKVAAYKNNRE